MPCVSQTSTLADKEADYCENHTVVPRILENQQFNHIFFFSPWCLTLALSPFQMRTMPNILSRPFYSATMRTSFLEHARGRVRRVGEGSGGRLGRPRTLSLQPARGVWKQDRTEQCRVRVCSPAMACPGSGSPRVLCFPGPWPGLPVIFRVGRHWCFLPQENRTDVRGMSHCWGIWS